MGGSERPGWDCDLTELAEPSGTDARCPFLRSAGTAATREGDDGLVLVPVLSRDRACDMGDGGG